MHGDVGDRIEHYGQSVPSGREPRYRHGRLTHSARVRTVTWCKLVRRWGDCGEGVRIVAAEEVATPPEADMTPERRVDAGIADARFGQAGLGSLGLGSRMGTGGGGGGQFVFADLAELDSVTAQWRAERERVQQDGQKLTEALALCNPPADDMMSHFQASSLKNSLSAALEHNKAMFDYADGYVQKLEASRASMATTEHDNTAKLRTTSED